MPNRIFPTTKKDSLGSEKEFSGINFDNLASHIKTAQTDESADNTKLVAEAMALLEEKNSDRTAGADHLKDYQFKSKGESDDEGEDEDGDKKVVEGDESETSADTKKAKAGRAAQTQIGYTGGYEGVPGYEEYDKPSHEAFSDEDNMGEEGGCPQCGGELDQVDTIKGLVEFCNECGWDSMGEGGDDGKMDGPSEMDIMGRQERVNDPSDAFSSTGDHFASTEKKSRTARTRKVHFSSVDQLSAEAIEAAKSEGDEALVNAIVAARHERRVRLAAKIIEANTEQMETEKKMAKRSSKIKMTVTSPKQVEATAKPTKTASGFKSPTDFSASEREVFIKKAEAEKFPRALIEAMLGMNKEASISEEELAIREVMASTFPESTKKTLIASMARTAKLDSEQVARQKRYWKEELGYGDAAWIDDLFTTAYND